jgi:hypothetical protein
MCAQIHTIQAENYEDLQKTDMITVSSSHRRFTTKGTSAAAANAIQMMHLRDVRIQRKIL